jgi:hypothetical protein
VGRTGLRINSFALLAHRSLHPTGPERESARSSGLQAELQIELLAALQRSTSSVVERLILLERRGSAMPASPRYLCLGTPLSPRGGQRIRWGNHRRQTPRRCATRNRVWAKIRRSSQSDQLAMYT